MAICKCGCGREVVGRNSKYFASTKCYQKWYRKNRDVPNGMICQCGCGRALTAFKRRWFSNECNKRYYRREQAEREKKKRAEQQAYSNKGQPHTQRVNGRPAHLLTLCLKGNGCVHYYKGHEVYGTKHEKIIGKFTGCLGRKMYKEDGSCYEAEKLTNGHKSISSECRIL